MRTSILRAALLLLPTLVLAGWALWLPFSSAGDPGMRIRLLGYDPRDLLRGHYLSARLDIHGLRDRHGPNDCICLVDRPKDPGRPGFTVLPSCATEVLASCPMPLADPDRELRLYQSQERARALDDWLRDGKGVVDLYVRFDGKGGIAVQDIRVDGQVPQAGP